jgi:3-phosphoshikimate 1-carboxyvinyltransferase
VRDAQELRVKESDRIATVVAELRRLGVRAEERADGMVVEGGRVAGGSADSHGDHRLAMALGVAGLAASAELSVHNAEAVRISYPRFWQDLARLSAG